MKRLEYETTIAPATTRSRFVSRSLAKARKLLELGVDPTHAICAIADDGLALGVAGYKTAQGAFVAIGSKQLAAVYGRVGGAWRGLVLSLLDRPVTPGTLLMDGIFVRESAHGRGVGSALIEAIKAEAAARNCKTVRLDVIDTNPRARLLYERHGFVATKSSGIGPLRHVFGFRTATTMLFPVGDDQNRPTSTI